MAEIVGAAGNRSYVSDLIVAVPPSVMFCWACNAVAWIGLIAQVHEPLSVMLAVVSGWCSFEGIRMRSFPLAVTSLVNTWWLLA